MNSSPEKGTGSHGERTPDDEKGGWQKKKQRRKVAAGKVVPPVPKRSAKGNTPGTEGPGRRLGEKGLS